MRVVLAAAIAVLLFGCGSSETRQVDDVSVQPSAGAAQIPSSPDAAQVPPPLEVPAMGQDPEPLGEMAATSPGAADVTRGPCNLDNCAVVLGIATHEVAESVAHDDGGPGLYTPQGLYSAETAGQPGVWDAYGVQKIVQVWDISVLTRDDGVKVIQQRIEPLFRVGDSVLVDGDRILPWN